MHLAPNISLEKRGSRHVPCSVDRQISGYEKLAGFVCLYSVFQKTGPIFIKYNCLNFSSIFPIFGTYHKAPSGECE